MDYRKRMRDLRLDHDLTQKDAGKLLHLSQQGYSHIENGNAELKIDDLVTLCRFYEVSADYLLGLTSQRSGWHDDGNDETDSPDAAPE